MSLLVNLSLIRLELSLVPGVCEGGVCLGRGQGRRVAGGRPGGRTHGVAEIIIVVTIMMILRINVPLVVMKVIFKIMIILRII